MRLAKRLFWCVLVVNLVVYCFFVPAEMSGLMSRTMWHRCAAVMTAFMVVLLVFSVSFLFIDRRMASKGLLVLLLGVIIALLSPEL